MCPSTICASGVTPSAASHRMDAVGLRLNSDESSPDMIIISSPFMRAATLVARAM
jgi:hypothetical protein